MTDTQENYVWIQGIIASCNNSFHFEGVDRLIALYHRKHPKSDCVTLLHIQRADRWNAVHRILING